jgi:hypothetical protein
MAHVGARRAASVFQALVLDDSSQMDMLLANSESFVSSETFYSRPRGGLHILRGFHSLQQRAISCDIFKLRSGSPGGPLNK